MDPWIIWFFIGLGLIVSEFFIPGVILVFLGLAAWVVASLIYVGILSALAIQILVFGIASLVLTAGLRRALKGVLFGHSTNLLPGDTTLDEFTGKSALVLTDFSGPGALGKVEFKGAKWSARSEDELKPGEHAEIVSLDGLTLNVRRQWLNALPSAD